MMRLVVVLVVLGACVAYASTRAPFLYQKAGVRQLVGHFLIDPSGVVRRTSIEAQAGVGSLATFPRPSQLLEAARSVTQE